MKQEKLELVADFYEFTMSNGYFRKNKNEMAYFDIFFRNVPDGGGYAIVAGLEQVIEWIQNFKFDKEDMEYLRKQNLFDEKYLEYLADFKFTGDIWAIPEGTVVFPNEPLVTVRAPLVEAQLLETMLLLIINHQSLIATKTARIVRAAGRKTCYGVWSQKSPWHIGRYLWSKSSYDWWSSGNFLYGNESEI